MRRPGGAFAAAGKSHFPGGGASAQSRGQGKDAIPATFHARASFRHAHARVGPPRPWGHALPGADGDDHVPSRHADVYVNE